MIHVVVIKSRVAFRGGLERYAILIAQAFAQRGAKVTLLTTGEIIDIPNVEVVSLGKHPSFNIYATYFFDKEVQKWLKLHPPTLTFGLDRNIYQTHYRAGNGLHKIFLERKHTHQLSRLLAKLNPKNKLLLSKEKQLFENPNLKVLFANSSMIRDELTHNYAINPQKICVVHNGVDFKKYCFDEFSKQKSILKLKLNPSASHLLFLGNNYKRKGLDILLIALAKLASWNFHLLVVGKDKAIKHYIQLAESLNLSKKVTFYGHQHDLMPFYQASDCLILPTQYDPFANVTLEALAMGLFVITTRFNGGHEVLTDTSGIILNDPNSSTELIQALRHYHRLKKDFGFRHRMRKTIEHLDINSQLNKIVDLTLTSIEK